MMCQPLTGNWCRFQQVLRRQPDRPAANILMKQKTTLVILLSGIALAMPCWSDVVGVDASGTASSPGLLDPSTRTWKAVGTPFSLGAMTVNTAIAGGFGGAFGTQTIPLFNDYRHNGGSGALTVTLSGLDDSQTYNLAVMMAQNFLGGRGGLATITTAGASNPAAKSSNPDANYTTFVDGDNCVLFEGLRTGTTPGQITFTVSNGPDGIGILNGFEIQNVDPHAPGIRGPLAVNSTCEGEPISLTVKVTNTAAVDYHVTGTAYSGPKGAEFSDSTVTPLVIPAGSSSDLYVDFTPTGGGIAQATLTLSTDDPGASSVAIPLEVAVRDPKIAIGGSIAFGTFPALPGAATSSIEVSNLGVNSALTLTNPQISGSGAAAFSVTGLPGSIPASDLGELEVTFNPAAPGIFTAQLTLDTNDSAMPTVTVNLSGNVIGGGTPKMQWGFDFTSGTVSTNGGTVTDDSGSSNPGLLLAPGHGDGGFYNPDIPTAGTAIGQARNVTGLASLDLTEAAGVCTGSGAFSGQALNGLSAAAIEAAGGLTYEVWVKDIASTGSKGIVLTLAGMHGIQYDPSAGLIFGYGDGSETSFPFPVPSPSSWTHLAAVMVATPGNGAKTYNKVMIYVNGVKVAEDANGHTFPWFLERGASVGMHPVLGGENVTGTIYEPRISVGTLTPQEFTVVAPPAGIFAPKNVAATNQGEADQLTIALENTSSTSRSLTAPTLSGPNAALFSVSQFPSTLNAASNGQITVDFNSAAAGGGTFTATLTIHSNDPARPSYEVTLTVEVHDPTVAALDNLNFGQLTGPGTALGTWTINNNGLNRELILSNPQFSGSGAAAYSLGTPLAPVAPNTSGQIGVNFNLAAVGSYPAQLTFDTNDPFKPTITVNLSGEVISVVDTTAPLVTSVHMVSATRLRIEFQGAANTAYLVKSSGDLASSPFTGAVTPAVNGLTTNDAGNGRGAGFVEIDVVAPGKKFFQIQSP